MAVNADPKNRLPDTNVEHERNKATPTVDDLTDPKEVWKDGETVPSRDRDKPRTGMLGRVADAGDIGGGEAPPYGTEAQADSIASQRPAGGAHHTARTFADQRGEAEDKLSNTGRNKSEDAT